MSKQPKTKFVLNAQLLRIVLSIGMLLVTAIAVGGFIYSLGIIKAYATEVSHKKVDAEASSSSIQALEKVESELNKNTEVLGKINLLKSDSQFPIFRIVDEVNKIAAKNNLVVEGFAPTDAAGAAAPAAGTATPATPVAPVTAGGNTIAFTVTLKSPVVYKDLLQFTYDIEQNLPKMKIRGLSITSGGGSTTSGQTTTAPLNSSQVTVEPLIIEMYVN